MKYLTEAHGRNTEAALGYIAESKKKPFTLEEARRQQERNCRDNYPVKEEQAGCPREKQGE
jgi:hypothetical protein